jgi:hypothetical protein
MYGNDMLDDQGRVKTSEAHLDIVLLDGMLTRSGIPHVMDKKRFDGWQINYPEDLIGYGRVYTVRQCSLTDGSETSLVELWDNETDEIKAVSIMQAYECILCHHIGKELDK